MNINDLARGTLARLQPAEATTEPMLCFEGNRYTAGQLETMLENGELARLDGQETTPKQGEVSHYALSELYPRVSAAQQFLRSIKHNSKQLYVAYSTTTNEGQPLPAFELAAPAGYECITIQVVYNSEAVYG